MSKTRRLAILLLTLLLACSTPTPQEQLLANLRSADVCVVNDSRDAVEVKLYEGRSLVEVFRDVSMVRPSCVKIRRNKLDGTMYAVVSPYGHPRRWRPEALQRMRFDGANHIVITIGHEGLTRYGHSTYTIW